VRNWPLVALILLLPVPAPAQHRITIDGNFDDWADVPVAVTDPADDVHDTDWFSDGLSQPRPRRYSDVDVLEVRFTDDGENLFGYMRAAGKIGRTSRSAAGQKAGRYYFIFTIDVDHDTVTGYRLAEGNYWPDSRGYDMNMEVEFYDGAFNTGHYINHEFLNEEELRYGREHDLPNGIVRLKPGSYDYYLEWVMFEDSTYVEVSDRGPVYKGIIEIAVSPDSHEAEIKAPMWGFLKTPEGEPIIAPGKTIVVSASLEGSGELSEEAVAHGYRNGTKSFWGSDTAEPFEYTVSGASGLQFQRPGPAIPDRIALRPCYPNPFNGQTVVSFSVPRAGMARVEVIDLLGRRVATLLRAWVSPGVHRFRWAPARASAGLYLIVLEFEGVRQVQRVLYLP